MSPWEQVAITVFTAVLASSGIWSVILFRMQRRENEKEREKEKDSVESKALKALLHDRIFTSCKEAISAGTVSPDDYNNLKYLYDPYRALGGNGTAKRMMDEVEQLPLDVEKRKEEDDTGGRS